MEDKIYPWQRLWVPGSSVDDVLAHSTYFTPQAGSAPLEYWQSTTCLILLGEPGMGKSAEWTRQPPAPMPGASCALNLGDFSRDRQLKKALEKMPAVKRWLRQPGTALWLWLDSYDEALLHEAKLAPALLRMFAEWPTAGLHLRIMSRTATWPNYLIKELTKHFGREQAVVVLQLAPLTQEQVRQAAEAEAIDADAFEAAVARAEAVALASRPVTLRLLLKMWQAGRFNAEAGRGVDLLESGCRLLCEEGWDEKRSTYRQFDPERRFRLAAQLALLMVGSGRQVITYNEADDGSQRLRLRDVTDEPILFADKTDPVPTRASLINLLENSGLFVSNGTEVRWTHPVFADFLAAWALRQARIPAAQLRNLLRAEVPEAGLVPALRDMGVWLASLSPDFAADLVQLDPLTAIRADGLTTSEGQRALLVEQLLALTAARHFYPYRAEANLGRLTHPGLAAQLEAVLGDPAISPETQWLAHKIAESCAVKALVPLLLKQALDPGLPIRTRVEALRTLRQLAGPGECQVLRPLLTSLPPDDEDDEFRGGLLLLLWPQEMTMRELLPLLTPRRKSSLFGAYHLFLNPAHTNRLQEGLTAANLPSLLRWLVRRRRSGYGANQWVIESVRTTALRVAWRHTNDPAVLPWLAWALRYWLLSNEVDLVPEEAKSRRQVLTCWINRHRVPHSWDLTQRHPIAYARVEQQSAPHQALVDEADFDFVVAQLYTTVHPATAARLLAIALDLLTDAFNAQALDFQTRFATLFEAVQQLNLTADHAWQMQLDNANTQRSRERHAERKAIQRQKRRETRLARRWNYRTYRLLIRLTDSARPNPARSWFRAWRLLSRSGNGNHNTIQTEVRQEFPWQRTPLLVRARLVALAWRVVREAPPQVAAGQRYNSFSGQQAAPLAALLLCQDERPQAVATLTAAEWQPWLRAILFGWVSQLRRTELFGVARQQHRRAVLRCLADSHDFWGQVVTEEHGYGRLNELLQEVPDEALWRCVLQGIMRGRWPRTFNQEVLTQLLKLGFYSARLFREALFAQSYTTPVWHVLTVSAFRTALLETKSVTDWWHTWQQLLRLGPESASFILQQLEGRPSWTAPIPPALSDEQLASLLHWIVREVGIIEENDPDDWRRGNGPGRLRTFRNGVAKVLAERATSVAWHTLRELADELAFPRWLTYYLDEARETYCRLNWQAPAPPQLLGFLRSATKRWPHSSADLLDLVVESLNRFQTRLQGEPTRAQHLWHKASQLTGYRIVRGNKVDSENKVTDFVQGFLHDDLVQHLFSTQREVQLRAAAGAQRGQELDLYVQAVPLDESGRPRSGERLLVFIEAKHHDNPEVATALHAQLVNRYLRQHEARTGLFLVYWHKPGATAELLALRQRLVHQAAEASVDGLLIKSYVLDIRLPDDQ